MNLLLDTHIWIWCLIEPNKIKNNISVLIRNPKNTLYLSSISIWEFLILVEKKRLNLKISAEDWIREARITLPIIEVPVDSEVAIESRNISLKHQDPADRFIVATAKISDLH